MSANRDTTGTPRMRATHTRVVTLKPSWADYEYGPYERFPEPRRLVLEGYLMQRYDPTVGAAMTLIKRLIISRLGDYTHPEERVQEFVRTVIDRLRDGRAASIGSLLSCLWAGFAVAAKRWEASGSGWTISALDLLHPLTLFPVAGVALNDAEKRGIRTDDDGAVVGFRQFPEKGGAEPVDFERTDCLYWPFLQELREEVYGRRLTDKARRSWFMRAKLEQYWAIFLEKYAHPIPVFRVPKGMQQDARGNDITSSEFYAGFINNLTAGQGLAIECEPDEQFAFDLLESRGGSGDAYQTAARYHNAEVFKAMLTSPLMFEEASQGTRAQGTVALDITLMLVDAIREELGAVLVNELARPLVDYNFGARDDYGTWEFEALRDDDLEGLARVFETVNRAQVIRPNDADERKARELFAPAGFAREDEITAEDLAAAEAQEQQEAEDAAAAQEARMAALKLAQSGKQPVAEGDDGTPPPAAG